MLEFFLIHLHSFVINTQSKLIMSCNILLVLLLELQTNNATAQMYLVAMGALFYS